MCVCMCVCVCLCVCVCVCVCVYTHKHKSSSTQLYNTTSLPNGTGGIRGAGDGGRKVSVSSLAKVSHLTVNHINKSSLICL
jgi:hypothetical protein